MSKQDIILNTAIFSSILLIYIVTLPPTVFWQDAGIYLAGIKVEGNVYPPGYPIYMIGGLIWTHLVPIGTFTQKVHLLSAIFSAIAGSIVYKTIKEIIDTNNTQSNNKESLEKQTEISKSKENNYQKTSVSILAATLFTLNYSIWSQAINAEVYALHILFYSAILFLVVKVTKNRKIGKIIDSNNKINIIMLGIIVGVSFANHPMAVVLVPVYLYLLYIHKNLLFHPKLIIASLILCCAAALLPYIYLPLVANTEPVLNWGNPNTLTRFIKHVTGSVYLTNDQSLVLNDPTRYQAIANEFIWEYGYIGIIMLGLGLYYIYKANKYIFTIFLISIISHVFFAIFYKQTTEYNAWLIPAHYTVILITAYAVFVLINNIKESLKDKSSKEFLLKNSKNSPQSNKPLSKAIAACLILLLFSAQTIIQGMKNFSELNRSQYYYAEDFGKNILRNLDSNSIILMTGDQESSTTMYLQLVEGYRTDIIAIKNIEFDELETEEGRRIIKNRYPTLIMPKTSSSNQEEINLNDYLNELIQANITHRSIYLMSKSLLQLDPTKFTIQPAAAMWKVEQLCEQENVCIASDINLKYWNFEYHDPQYYKKNERPLMSLKDASKPGGINRVPFIQHMVNYELQSWKNLGDWYLSKAQCDKAEEAYNRMQKVDSNIYNELPQIKQQLNTCKS